MIQEVEGDILLTKAGAVPMGWRHMTISPTV